MPPIQLFFNDERPVYQIFIESAAGETCVQMKIHKKVKNDLAFFGRKQIISAL